MSIENILSSFILGLLTPLTAVCVLPLYPAFLAFLANKLKGKASRKSYALLGLLIISGVILFMLILGLLFTTVLQISLTNVISIVSPIAFIILGLISLLLIFNVDFSRFLPKIKTPHVNNPLLSSLIYGFFFGAIVIPCNPAFISAFFARSLLFGNFLNSMLNFLFFGLGLGAPLLAFSLIPSELSHKIIKFLTRHKKIINVSAGVIMLGISLYYLIFVFEVFG